MVLAAEVLTVSWEQLQDIVREATDLAAEAAASPPAACPNDGTPLQTGPGGQLFCPFDGWRPDNPYTASTE